MELTGKIVSILPEQKFNGKNEEIVKNAFVIEWQDNGYTQKLCLEVMGEDKWNKMQKAVVVGNEVLVKYDATSREWQGKWFTSCQCFYCSNVGGQQQTQTRQTTQAPQAQGQQQENDDNGLPF